jgi:hypothetical protein
MNDTILWLIGVVVAFVGVASGMHPVRTGLGNKRLEKILNCQ